jgi:hypothetical protein
MSHRHDQSFRFGQSRLVAIERQEFARPELQGRGNMQDVGQPVPCREGVGTARRLRP